MREREMTPAEFETADQAFVTSTTRDLLPVIEIEGRATPQNAPVLDHLRKAFVDYRQVFLETHRGGGFLTGEHQETADLLAQRTQ
jgi:hypothetical protein